MSDVLMRMTGTGYGVAIIIEGQRLTGIITDGDLRRNMDGLMTRPRRGCRDPQPQDHPARRAGVRKPLP